MGQWDLDRRGNRHCEQVPGQAVKNRFGPDPKQDRQWADAQRLMHHPTNKNRALHELDDNRIGDNQKLAARIPRLWEPRNRGGDIVHPLQG
jgi:hypothetical protein